MRKTKKIILIVCFTDHTWEECEVEIGEALHSRRNREEVEDRVKDEIELKYYQLGKSVENFMVDYWGPEEE